MFNGNQALGGRATDNTRGGIAQGGGLLASGGSTVTANNVTFTDNRAVGGSGGVGVGSDGSRPDGLGGGASLQDNSVNINGIVATGNSVQGGNGSQSGGNASGGALFFEFSTGQVRNGVLNDNSSRGGDSPNGNGGFAGGGALMALEANLTLDRLTMIGNSSIGGNGNIAGGPGGGALYVTDVPGLGERTNVFGSNLILAHNRAEAGTGQNRFGGGGAVFSQNSQVTLVHTTLASNSVLSTMYAPAILLLSYGGGSNTLDLSYSIIANHEAGTTADAIAAISANDVVNLNYDLFFGNAGKAGAYNGADVNNQNEVPSGDPQFVSPGPPNYNYHIQAGSAARDRAVGSTTPHDIDGDSRTQFGIPDVGADEYRTP